PWVDFVPTKKAISKFSAKNYSPLLIDEMVQEAVENALQKDKEEVPLYAFEPPVALRIEFNSTSKADQASLVPYTKRLDGRTVEFSAEDYSIIMEAIIAMVDLASLTTM
ncbi:MAG: M55 family metallopeptidase, partial [Candidatus Syntrophosphaera sp.]